MEPIIRACGYFFVFLAAFAINSITVILLLTWAEIPMTSMVLFGTGALTTVEGILCALMHDSYWSRWREVEKARVEEDGRYRRMLLEVAEGGLEKEAIQLQVESEEYRPAKPTHLQQDVVCMGEKGYPQAPRIQELVARCGYDTEGCGGR